VSMTVNEARTEIKTLFGKADEIERKYPEGEITNNEDMVEVKRILTEIDGLEDKLATLEDTEMRRKRITDGLDRFARPAVTHKQTFGDSVDEWVSPGDQFVRSGEYRHMAQTGAFQSTLQRNEFAVNLKDGTSMILWKQILQNKALVYSASGSAGGLVANDMRPGVLDILQREINVLDLIPRLTTDSDMVEYVREDTFTNNAAMTAEATGTSGVSGSKPESVLAYSTQTSAVRTLAHWVPVTNRMLADAPAIRGIINSRLLLGLTLVLESQILTGGGTGEDFLGLLAAASGINVQSLGADNVLDAIFKGRTKVRVTGRARPTGVIMHPNDWEAVRLARENTASATLGGYLMGPPSAVGATTVWGLPVVESEAETENTALVGDFSMGCSLFDREQASIRVGLINDQFTRNMQTILAELRAAFVIWRPTAFTRVTGI
jgi:HK97 family phage major capsid protein